MERNVVEFSEGEFIIRSYQCLVQKSAFSKPSDGYLQVTNKRVIYSNNTSSGGTSSLLVSEVPLEDVGSITSFVGRSMNLALLLPFVILSTLASMQLPSVLPEFMTHWLFGLFLKVIRHALNHHPEQFENAPIHIPEHPHYARHDDAEG